MSPPGAFEPDKASLWTDLSSLDSVILVIVTCNCLPFSCLRSIFRGHIYFMTSAENNVSQPPNLKIFWARPPYKARVFGTRDIAKKLATTVASPGQKIFQHRIAFPADTNTYPICDSSLYKSPSVADPRGPRSFLYLDQTEARRAERNYLRPSPPPPPPPLYFSCASHATAISFLQQKDLC